MKVQLLHLKNLVRIYVSSYFISQSHRILRNLLKILNAIWVKKSKLSYRLEPKRIQVRSDIVFEEFGRLIEKTVKTVGPSGGTSVVKRSQTVKNLAVPFQEFHHRQKR